MIDKPVMNKVIGVRYSKEDTRLIQFDTDEQRAEQLKDWGDVRLYHGSFYSLKVDARFDFNEVLAYIESLND